MSPPLRLALWSDDFFARLTTISDTCHANRFPYTQRCCFGRVCPVPESFDGTAFQAEGGCGVVVIMFETCLHGTSPNDPDAYIVETRITARLRLFV